MARSPSWPATFPPLLHEGAHLQVSTTAGSVARPQLQWSTRSALKNKGRCLACHRGRPHAIFDFSPSSSGPSAHETRIQLYTVPGLSSNATRRWCEGEDCVTSREARGDVDANWTPGHLKENSKPRIDSDQIHRAAYNKRDLPTPAHRYPQRQLNPMPAISNRSREWDRLRGDVQGGDEARLPRAARRGAPRVGRLSPRRPLRPPRRRPPRRPAPGANAAASRPRRPVVPPTAPRHAAARAGRRLDGADAIELDCPTRPARSWTSPRREGTRSRWTRSGRDGPATPTRAKANSTPSVVAMTPRPAPATASP